MTRRRTAQRTTARLVAAIAGLGLLPGVAAATPVDSATVGSSAGSGRSSVGQLPATVAIEPFWSEEFDGGQGTRPTPKTWTSEVGNRRQRGWWNNELQYYTARPANAALDGRGRLRIRALAAPRGQHLPCWPRGRCAYTSARLTTEGTVSLAYGRVDVRAKLPTGRGLLPAIWMLGNNGRVWPRQGEIDIVEVVGGEPRRAYGTAHGPTYFNEGGLGGTTRLDGRASDSFHVYSVVKEPERITWLVDDEAYFTLTPPDLPAAEDWVFEQDLHLILNVAVGGDWPGDPGPATRFPATMSVDYVRLYGQGVVDGVEVPRARS